MALVTVQRSPSSSSSPQSIDSANGVNIGDEIDMGRNSKSLSECYFAGKGTALVLPAASEAQKTNRQSGAGSNIQKHLQSMFYLLRPEETLKMAVKLESVHPVRTRYLVVVSRMGARAEESCLLGIDCNERTTVGMVLKVLADTAITLDGDGGFSVTVCERHHIFKPVSVQAMWSALQTLHKVSSKAREQNYFQGGVTHAWVNYYEERIKSDRSCLNEWNAMDNLESRRAPSPDSARTKPTKRDETERVIKSTLKEIMMSVDLDEVTSKYIRGRLEEFFNMDLAEYKSFIDQEMLTILGQMDAPTEIFDHVYLGSEWNASNYEELRRNGVGHILNVTREIDNFFPGTFDYLNVRVYDDEKTDLLRHWDNTFRYITKAKRQGSKVLVHCKMGVSRSASVVIAYAMKAYNWNFAQAMEHVKLKRSCIKPNSSFLTQLETYQGILDAMKNKEKLQRSKSETNLKSPGLVAKNELILAGSEPKPIVKTLALSNLQATMSGQDLRQLGARPKSWSPDGTLCANVPETKTPPVFRSLENLNQSLASCASVSTMTSTPASATATTTCESPKAQGKSLRVTSKDSARNVLLPCDNGESYSVSPNQIMHIPNRNSDQPVYLASVKERISELEAKKKEEKKKLVLNLLPQFVSTSSEVDHSKAEASSPKTDTWDPGQRTTTTTTMLMMTTTTTTTNTSTSTTATQTQNPNQNGTTSDCDLKCSASDEDNAGTVPEVRLRTKAVATRNYSDLFSNQVDRVFDREERKQQRVTVIPATTTGCTDEEIPRNCPSRQSSWSSYDSAVGLGYQGETRETPSRHSSWGSGDTRILPSRNSSWGSYDMRNGNTNNTDRLPQNAVSGSNDLIENSTSGIFPYDKEDIPWNPGTVRRTKQRLEENSKHEDRLKTSNEQLAEAINSALYENGGSSSSHVNISSPNVSVDGGDIHSRLSVSAPEKSNMELLAENNSGSLSRSASNIGSNIISTAQCSSVKQHRTFLENFHRDMARKEEPPELETSAGMVQILKKEFEAKNHIEPRVQQMNITNIENTERRSVPSSPTNCCIPEKPPSPTSSDPGENVKELRGKFEKKLHKSSPPPTSPAIACNRYSCVEVSVEKSPVRIKQTPLITGFKSSLLQERSVESEFKRPPMIPVVRNAPNLVIPSSPPPAKTNNSNKKQTQQQYGKSHPLAQLSIKQRHNNPVYNTM